MNIYEFEKFKICNPDKNHFVSIPLNDCLLEVDNILFATSFYTNKITEKEKSILKKVFDENELDFNCFVFIRPISLVIRQIDKYTTFIGFSLNELKSLLWKYRKYIEKISKFYLDGQDEIQLEYLNKDIKEQYLFPLKSKIFSQGLNYAYNYLSITSDEPVKDFCLNFMDTNYKPKKTKNSLLLSYL
ncbi:MAG: hypothetical protein GY849_02140 [Deltaproteobacteria bacterium]|nr:hypothetical protein [Deltaproteobacteria bacterium]